MTFRQFEHPEALAAELADYIEQLMRERPTMSLGLAAGASPLRLYRQLCGRTARGALDWSKARTFNLDEFVGLGAGDAGSYHQFMRKHLFDHLALRDEQASMLNGRAPDLGAECVRYERAISAAGGIDLQLLGIGVNGHIGFNEPGDALHARTHVAELLPSTRERNAALFGGDVNRVPRQGLSMGMATILQAGEVVLIASGADKAAAVGQMRNGLVTPRVPASFLQLHPRATVWLDRDAAAALFDDQRT